MYSDKQICAHGYNSFFFLCKACKCRKTELSPGHVMLIQLDDTSLVVVTGLHRTDKPRMFAHPWGTIEQRGANTRGP